MLRKRGLGHANKMFYLKTRSSEWCNNKYVFMIYFTTLSDEQIMQDGVKSLETGCLTFRF